MKLGESPLFSAGIILHPGLEIRYLEINWAIKEQLVWVRDAKTGLSRYFVRWYRRDTPQGTYEQPVVKGATAMGTAGKRRKVSEFKQWVKSKMNRAAAIGSELNRYMRMET